MGSNFEKTKKQSRVHFMYEMQHFVHNFPPAPEEGFSERHLVFQQFMQEKIAIFGGF